MVSLEFVIDIIVPAALWLRDRILSLEIETVGTEGPQTYRLQMPTVLISGSLNILEPYGPGQGLLSLY
jgi:hypothetical protein